jgi:cytochrome c oxidase subunit 3
MHFHLVTLSPWPILVSTLIFTFTVTSIAHIDLAVSIDLAVVIIIIYGIALIIYWWRDVIRESTGGFHTHRVHKGLMVGFILFLLSEIMLFVSFFWAFFHSSLAPVVELYLVVPLGINAVSPLAIPLLGSSVLLASGFISTLAILSLYQMNRGTAILSLVLTVLLGLLFILLQFNEYCYGEFTIADSVSVLMVKFMFLL